jgi:avirulence protein
LPTGAGALPTGQGRTLAVRLTRMPSQELQLPDSPRSSVSSPTASAAGATARQSALLPHERQLIGLARWPDKRYNKEATDSQRRYGESFQRNAQMLGHEIGQGRIRDVHGLWQQCRDWRLHNEWIAHGNPLAADPFCQPRSPDTPYRTPIGGRYRFVHGRVLQAIEKGGTQCRTSTELNNETADGHQMWVHEFQCQTTVKGKVIPLTAMQAFTAPDSGGPSPFDRSAPENTTPSRVGVMMHTRTEHVADLMNHANEIFMSLRAQQADHPTIVGKLAEMHWTLAHAMPDERGSAAKSEMAVRAAAYSVDLELPPFRNGIVPDLEAFVTPLDEFKKNYEGFFEDLNAGPRNALRKAVSGPL